MNYVTPIFLSHTDLTDFICHTEITESTEIFILRN